MLVGHLWELVALLAIALIVFGPMRLPEVAAALGRGIRQFRESARDDRVQIEE